MTRTILTLAVSLISASASLADTLHVKVQEYVLAQNAQGEPSFVSRGEPQSWEVPSTKEVAGHAKLNKTVGFHIEVSGRGRINIDLANSTYSEPRRVHAQDDFFSGMSSLAYNYSGDVGGACKIEIMAWITR